ncbi:MAG: hypothetical protein KKA63_00560, partial [Gammaproteobacteria bacterium]|nr:hypothetical protein [Gammaproteobacteria bacterium]
FEYDLYASAMDRAMGSPTISLKQSLPSLAGKKITLSFAPATPSDANLIASYLSATTTSLPGYLIRLTAEFRVDGQVVATGGNFTMGDELASSAGLFDPVNGWNFAEDNRPIAGEYIATHVDLQGVSTAQLQVLKGRMVATQAKLTAAQYTGITKEDIAGDILYSAVLSYFATNQATSQIAQRTAGVVEYRKPSFGNFETSAKPQYWFGIPRNVSFPGLVMDIDHYESIVEAKDSSSTVGFVKQSGMLLSINEHVIPEQLFTNLLDPNHPQGVSAVRAIELAASQGQRIYTFNHANQAQHQTLLAQITIDPQAMTEIQNGLAAGKEITVHQAPITLSGWTGSGYIISDPATGSGAYKIAGGANGGALLKTKLLEIAFEEGIKLSPIVAVVEMTLSMAVEKIVNDPSTCLFDTQRASLKDAIANLNMLGRVGFVPGAPGLTVDIAVIVGWYFLAATLYNFVNINRSIGDCK